METVRRRLARLEAANPNALEIGDVRKATDAQLEAYIIASDIEARNAAGLPAIEYRQPLSDVFVEGIIRLLLTANADFSPPLRSKEKPRTSDNASSTLYPTLGWKDAPPPAQRNLG